MLAATAPKKPKVIPSNIKGQRINQSVAPTYFIISTSLRRAKTVKRIVLTIIKRVAAPRKRAIIIPLKRSTLIKWNKCSTTSCPKRAVSTLGILVISLVISLITSGLFTCTSKEFGKGLSPPKDSKIFCWSPKRSLKRSKASFLEIGVTLTTPFIFSSFTFIASSSSWLASSCI